MTLLYSRDFECVLLTRWFCGEVKIVAGALEKLNMAPAYTRNMWYSC
jgi:hypothetical protein